MVYGAEAKELKMNNTKQKKSWMSIQDVMHCDGGVEMIESPLTSEVQVVVELKSSLLKAAKFK